VNTFGTGKISNQKLEALVLKHFDLKPASIIKSLDLLKPGYKETAKHGHFGRKGPRFTWEKTDKAEALKKDA
jgi:S-adenosylmethionine synthetase